MGIEILFENQTANGDSTVIDIKDGGYRTVKATGTFGGATITMLIDFNDDDYAELIEENTAQTFTIPGAMNLQPLKSGCRLKATVSGAGGSTDITLKII